MIQTLAIGSDQWRKTTWAIPYRKLKIEIDVDVKSKITKYIFSQNLRKVVNIYTMVYQLLGGITCLTPRSYSILPLMYDPELINLVRT